jgi:hypothetical protein
MVTREQIRKTLNAIYDAEYGDGDGELTLADGISFLAAERRVSLRCHRNDCRCRPRTIGKAAQRAWLVCRAVAGRVQLYR